MALRPPRVAAVDRPEPRGDRGPECGGDDRDDGFTIVDNRRRKKKVNIVGSRKPVNGSIKSATKSADLYVGNCDPEVTVESLTQYLLDEMQIKIDKGEQLVSRNPNCASFKISLNLSDRMKLLSPDVWPEGVICRKYYNPKRNQP